MDLKQVKDLMETFEKNAVHKFKMKKGDFEIVLEKEPQLTSMPVMASPAVVSQPQAQPHLPPHKDQLEQKPAPQADSSSNFITSPIVGTFYASPAPGDPAFVKVGDTVDENTVVAIVEAMKVMNEVKAGITGVVQEIMLDSGSPVEYGTKIIRVS